MIAKDDHGELMIELHGSLRFVASVPVTMYTRLSADTAGNALVIEVGHLKAFSVVPVTKLIRWTPLSLSRLIALPPNRSLFVDGNRILVKPFGFSLQHYAQAIPRCRVELFNTHAVQITMPDL